MKLFLTFTKKSLAATIAAVVVGVLVLGQFAALGTGGPDGSTHAIRIRYLQSLGMKTEETPEEVKDIVIPETFSDVYKNYNHLQQSAGFDLSGYKGKKATVYTYRLAEDEKKTVTLIICGGRIIGGDISDVTLGGEMRPLLENNQ